MVDPRFFVWQDEGWSGIPLEQYIIYELHVGTFGYYFTDKDHTPWGPAMNFDGPDSDRVREFFITNALYWIDEFHMDSLRLDAVDWILNQRAQHFLQQIVVEVHCYRVRRGRQVYLFAENDTNDARLINPVQYGGYGMDAQWCDNFHRALGATLTGETTGYYEDFGQFSQIVKAYSDGFVYTGDYSTYRKRCHGGPVGERPTSQFVVFCQNHDQVGNRKCGDRLSAVQSLGKLLLAAGLVLLPYLPLLFMGEEYGEKAPFHYFVGYTDPDLIEAVRKGKHEEHASGVCEGELPDPEAVSSFLESKIDLRQQREGDQVLILAFYRQLLSLHKRLPAMQVFNRLQMEVTGLVPQKVMIFRRQAQNSAVVCIFSFSNTQEPATLNLPKGTWEKLLDSSTQH